MIFQINYAVADTGGGGARQHLHAVLDFPKGIPAATPTG